MADKTLFDGEARTITIKDGVTSIDVEKDFYSAWKIWVKDEDNFFNRRWSRAFDDTFGGDVTDENPSNTQYAPKYFFLDNDWVIVANNGEQIRVQTNLYTRRTDGIIYEISNNTAILSASASVPVVQSEIEQRIQYGGVVYVDSVNGGSGQAYPWGTSGQPVSTPEDALAIAGLYHLRTFDVTGDVTLTSDASGFKIKSGAGRTVITLTGTTLIDGEFEDCYIGGDIGILSDSLKFVHCYLEDGIENVCGNIKNTAFLGELNIKENCEVFFINCYSAVPGNESPTLILDINPLSITEVTMRGYMGGLLVQNFNSPNNKATLAYNSGKCTLDNSNTDGFISLRGFPFSALTDNSAGTVVDTTPLLASQESIDDTLQKMEYGDKLVFNADNGESGTAYPVGTHAHPVNNLTDLKTIMEERYIDTVHLDSDITLNEPFEHKVIVGHSGRELVICMGISLEDTYLENVYIVGSSVGNFRGERIGFVDGYTGARGAFIDSVIMGKITVYTDLSLFLNCISMSLDNVTPEISFAPLINGSGKIIFRNFAGGLNVTNMNDPEHFLSLIYNAGRLKVSSSCTEGNIRLAGLNGGAIMDESDGTVMTHMDSSYLNDTQLQQIRDALALKLSDGVTPNIESIDHYLDRIDKNTQE